jgi:tungstate transport system substrate-binding protein
VTIVGTGKPRASASALSCAGWAAATACFLAAGAACAEPDAPVVRVASVNTPYQSGLLEALLPAFEKMSGYRVEVYGGSDVYERAEAGKADLVISHYGKAPVEPFVTGGKGLWPRPVFSNQSVLVGPKEDPAGIRGMKDPFEAMRRIASSGSKYVSPANPTGRYLSELLLAGAGNPERGDWYIESPLTRGRAMRFAEEEGAYTIWGSFPFERYRGKHGERLEALVWETPIFHRTMATVVVNPEKMPGVNIEGARALEAYLLSPGTQAAIAAYREKGLDRQTWWPAAFDNNPAQVLGSTAGDEED